MTTGFFPSRKMLNPTLRRRPNQTPLGVSVDLGNLRPPVRGASSSTGMPIREGIVNEKREVFSRPPDNFVIGDETMIERGFESSNVMETVLRDAQPVNGTMSSDTTRAGRSTTPKHQKATSRSPVRNSSRKRDFSAKRHKHRETLCWRSSRKRREVSAR